jgi:hypothetical protein
MDEIIEGTVGTLHILAKEAQSRVMIRGLKCTPLFVQVYSDKSRLAVYCAMYYEDCT